MNVICYGDSNTYGYDPRSYIADRYPPEYRWVDILALKTRWNISNDGLNGREIPSKSISVPDDTDLLIIMLGTNDVFYQSDPSVVANNMESFLSGISIARDRILLIAPPPMTQGPWITDPKIIDASKALSHHYMAVAERLQTRFVDAEAWNVPMAFDGVHFTEKGHKAFAEGLYNYLNKGD